MTANELKELRAHLASGPGTLDDKAYLIPRLLEHIADLEKKRKDDIDLPQLFKTAESLIKVMCDPSCSHEGCAARRKKWEAETHRDYFDMKEQVLRDIQTFLRRNR